MQHGAWDRIVALSMCVLPSSFSVRTSKVEYARSQPILPFSSRTILGVNGFERELDPVSSEFSFAIFGFAETNDHSLVLRDCGSTMTMRSEALDDFFGITTAGPGAAVVSGIISRVPGTRTSRIPRTSRVIRTSSMAG